MTVAPSSIDAWPFLITRGRTVGQRTVLAPAFLISTGRHVDLKTAVTDPQGTANGFLRQLLSLEPEGEFTLFFEKLTAHAQMIGGDTGYLLDESSRRVEITQGVIVTGVLDDIEPGIMSDAREITAMTFDVFWKADNREADPVEAPNIAGPGNAHVDLSRLSGRTGNHMADTSPPVSVIPAGDRDAGEGAIPAPENSGSSPKISAAWYRSPMAWLVIGLILAAGITVVIYASLTAASHSPLLGWLPIIPQPVTNGTRTTGGVRPQLPQPRFPRFWQVAA